MIAGWLKRGESLRRGGAGVLRLGFALLFCCAGLNAQSTATRRTSPDAASISSNSSKADTFELDKENSDRVAASPERIREILARKKRLFDEFARVSEMADSAPEAVDISEVEIAREVVTAERLRLFGPDDDAALAAGEL